MPVNLPDPERYFVVLDTNLFIARFFDLTAPDFRALARAHELGFVRVVVPEVVFEEVVRKFEERLVSAVGNARNELSDIERLLRVKHPLLVDVESEVIGFRGRLQNWCVDVDALRPSVDTTTVRELFERSMKRRKPFQSDTDRGMRDALLWCAVVQLPQDIQHVALVSSNIKDFGDPTGLNLHPDLVADLSPRAIRVRAELHRDVAALREAWLNRALELYQDDADISDAEGTFRKLGWPDEYGSDMRWEVEQFLTRELPQEFRNPEVDPLGSPSGIRFISTGRRGERMVELEAIVTYDVTANAIVHKPDVFELEELSNYSLDVWDWNEHMSAMSYSNAVDVDITAIVNMAERTIDSFQVNGVTHHASVKAN